MRRVGLVGLWDCGIGGTSGASGISGMEFLYLCGMSKYMNVVQ